MPSNHLILCHPLLVPSVFPRIRVFSSESVLCIRWPKCWSFSFSISPSDEYSGLISFRIDWFDLLAVQETLKSLLQHHSYEASILRCSAFFMAQQTIALTRWTFVSKAMSLLFNMLSRLVIVFLPLKKKLLFHEHSFMCLFGHKPQFSSIVFASISLNMHVFPPVGFSVVGIIFGIPL